jgi:hypothetical protein
MTKFYAGIGIVFTFFAGIVLRGLVLDILWGWFIVPVFHLPALGIAEAIGLSLIANYLITGGQEADIQKDAGEDALAKLFGKMILGPALVLLLGWAIHLFM